MVAFSTFRTKKRHHTFKSHPKLFVCQGIDEWVTTAVQHGQGGGDDKETVGEWA